MARKKLPIKRKKRPFERPMFYVVFDVNRPDIDMEAFQARIIDALAAYGATPTTHPFEYEFVVGYEP